MSTVNRGGTACFYWIGIAAALACCALVLAGNTELLWRFEHRAIPVSWMIGGAAILAFLAAEYCDVVHSRPREAADPTPQLSPEWETVDS